MPARTHTGLDGEGVGRLLRESAAARVAGLAGLWSLVGLASGLLRFAAGDAGPPGRALWTQIAHGWTAGVLWVPLTLLVVALHRRFPLERKGWRRPLAVHGGASLAVPLAYNLAFALLRPGAVAGGVLEVALAGYLRWLHITVAVYWGILALDRWWLGASGAGESPAERETTARDPERPGRGNDPLARVPVRKGSRTRVVEADEIVWIEGAGDYVRIHTADASLLASRRLGELAERLDPERFLRIHRSTIVNLERVRSYRPLGHGDYRVVLRGGTELKVSRTRGRAFRERVRSGRAPS